MLTKITILLTLISLKFSVFAQKIENVHFIQKNDSIFEIYYDITNAKPEQLFIIRLHYTTDGGKNYSDSLKFVTGDVGKGITGAKGKTIIWEAYKEATKLNGKTIKFDVKARISSTNLKNETGKIEYDSLNTSDDIENKDEAIVFYLKAIDGARKSNTDILYTNLRSAIDIDTSLKVKAKTDMEFAKYFKDDTFKSIVKPENSATQNETGTFIDTRDGKTYKTVKVVDQWWIAENLAYKADSGCWAYHNRVSFVSKYGYLYNWETAKTVCPSGWHLPSDTEWTTIVNYLGGKNVAGGKLKSTTGWMVVPNSVVATNESGFSALPGASRLINGTFTGVSPFGNWWSASEFNATNASILFLDYSSSGGSMLNYNKAIGISVRCVKDK